MVFPQQQSRRIAKLQQVKVVEAVNIFCFLCRRHHHRHHHHGDTSYSDPRHRHPEAKLV